jgi:hypothetical protein
MVVLSLVVSKLIGSRSHKVTTSFLQQYSVFYPGAFHSAGTRRRCERFSRRWTCEPTQQRSKDLKGLNTSTWFNSGGSSKSVPMSLHTPLQLAPNPPLLWSYFFSSHFLSPPFTHNRIVSTALAGAHQGCTPWHSSTQYRCSQPPPAYTRCPHSRPTELHSKRPTSLTQTLLITRKQLPSSMQRSRRKRKF